MQSRLLTRLDKQLAYTREPVAWARVQVERALYYARQGERAVAATIIGEVRSRFDARPDAEITAWISLAEAVNRFYAKPGPEGMDRLRRAQALARAIHHEELVPLCAAWLAHFEFNANQMPTMLAHAREVLATAKPEHHAAWARISLVLADAYHFAGRFDLAKGWYAKVREHALVQGDDAMTSAMLHNVAAIRTNNARIADAFGLDLNVDVRRAELEAESTTNYDFGIGTTSLKTLVPLVRAQLFTIQKRFSDALALFNDVLDNKHEEDLERRDACHHADRAWCLAANGDIQTALNCARVAEERILPICDIDDLACTHARLAAVYQLAGHLNNHNNSQVALLEGLTKLLSN
jgi:tetratricopeptide (TPR) repeat protein